MSSSSSDCECDVYRTYTPVQPLYSDLRHPMVYHAQVQRKQGNQKNEIKKNCFVKAFRWYTQEHVPLNKVVSNTNNQDFHGFASWLDEKYDEYVRCNLKGNLPSQCLKKPNSVQTNSLTDNQSHKHMVPIRHKLKSPWRRYRKCLNRRDVDATLKADKSIEIILKPKNFSRSTSECCQRCNRSNHTITIDLNTPSNLKSKSENIIYILNEKEICSILTDDKTRLEEMGNVDRIKESNRQARIRSPAGPHNDISCQCSNITFEKVNVSSQFSHTDKRNVCECVETKVPMQQIVTCCPCTESNTKFITICKEEPSVILKAAASSTSQKSLPMTGSINIMETRKTSFLNKINIEKNDPPLTSGKVSQTSDHAINLGDVTNPGHPIFVRIVCADKLPK